MLQQTELVSLRRGVMVAVAVLVGLALFSFGLLPAYAQDDGTDYWAEVNIGGPRTVFVPAECVTGLDFNPQSPGTEPDMSATDLNSFQRATIVCDTPLYDLPGGSVIEGEALTQGSSWLVNPVLWPSLSSAALQGETDQEQAEPALEAPSPETAVSEVRAAGV